MNYPFQWSCSRSSSMRHRGKRSSSFHWGIGTTIWEIEEDLSIGRLTQWGCEWIVKISEEKVFSRMFSRMLEELRRTRDGSHSRTDENPFQKWSSIPSSIDKLWLVEVVAVDKEYRGRGLSRVRAIFIFDVCRLFIPRALSLRERGMKRTILHPYSTNHQVLMEFGVEEATKKGVRGAAAEVVANASIAVSDYFSSFLIARVRTR